MKKTRIFKNVFGVLAIALTSFFMTSCEKKLNETERSIIRNEIANDFFQKEVMKTSSDLNEYLWDGVMDYTEEVRANLETDIRAEEDMPFNIAKLAYELYGENLYEKSAQRYHNYQNYTRLHQEDLSETLSEFAKIISQKPAIVQRFNDRGFSSVVGDFASANPSAIQIDSTDVHKVASRPLDREYRVNWGMDIMGLYKTPSFSPAIALYCLLIAVSDIEVPKPVYAVYDEEDYSWKVGYNNGIAVAVQFTEKGDVTKYEYSATDYQKAYIDSENNILKKL